MASPADYQKLFGVGKRGASASTSVFGDVGYSYGAYSASSLRPALDQPFQRGYNTADNEVSYARENVTAWTRHLWRNDPKLATLYRLKIEAVVGTSLRVEATPMFKLLKRDAIWADDWSSEVEMWFKAWGADDEFRCDAHQSLNWGSLAKLAYSYYDAEGESLAVVRMLDRGGLFETCVEVLDPERLCNPYGKSNFMVLANGNRVVDGVEINALGAAVAYHIRVMHEADATASIDKFRWERIERFNGLGRPNVIHAVDMRRASQRRGLAAMAAGITTINQYDEYERAVIDQYKNHAKLFPFLKTSAPVEEIEAALPTSAGSASARRELFDHVHESRYANPMRVHGTQVMIGTPEETLDMGRGDFGDSPSDFLRMGDKQISGLEGVPHPVAFNSWDEITYSSGQMMLAYSNRGEQQQLTEFGAKWGRAVFGCVLEEMLLKGRVKPARRFIDFYTMKAGYTACKFHGPGNIVGDPVKDGLSADYLLNQGRVSWSELVAMSGRDPDEVRQARLRDMRKDEAAGLPVFVPFKGSKPDAETDSAATDNQDVPAKKQNEQVSDDDA
jgi:lambda family phage portal protein